tara:strand:- start:1939 stop:2217 length:279 start_codon:yes stop_codon:yes gene_type:complete
MEIDDILTLKNHNNRFQNYDQLHPMEKLTLIRETATAIDIFVRDDNTENIKTMGEIKDYIIKLPDVKLIQTDINQKLLILIESNSIVNEEEI